MRTLTILAATAALAFAASASALGSPAQQRIELLQAKIVAAQPPVKWNYKKKLLSLLTQADQAVIGGNGHKACKPLGKVHDSLAKEIGEKNPKATPVEAADFLADVVVIQTIIGC